MRLTYPLLAMLLVSSCDQLTGGPMPIDARKILGSLDGPKVPTMEETQMEAAKNAEKKGDYNQAIQIYQQILDRNENNSEALLALADSLRRSGEYDKAIATYDALISKDAKNLSAKEGKGLAIMAKGDYETPVAIFDEVIKADGKRWKSLNAMGVLFVTRNLYNDAQKYFDEALRQSPNNISVMNNIGLTKSLSKDFPGALDMLSKASAQSTVASPERKRIDLNMALVYAAKGDIESAEKIARNYLSGAQLSNNLGLYAHLAKDDQLAKTYLNMALTESKVYYEKAWENLDAINSTKNTTTQSSKKLTLPTENPEESITNEKHSKKKGSKGNKASKNQSQQTAASAPVTDVKAEALDKNTSQTLGTIKPPEPTPEAN